MGDDHISRSEGFQNVWRNLVAAFWDGLFPYGDGFSVFSLDNLFDGMRNFFRHRAFLIYNVYLRSFFHPGAVDDAIFSSILYQMIHVVIPYFGLEKFLLPAKDSGTTEVLQVSEPVQLVKIWRKSSFSSR